MTYLRSALRAIGRERAVIGGFVIAVVQAWVAGQITKETAIPVIGGIALRFFVTPYHRPAARRPDRGDHADHAKPELFHGGRPVL